MHRPLLARFLALAVLFAVAAVCASCGVPQGDLAVIDEEELPGALKASTTTTTVEPTTDAVPDDGDVAVYWIGDKRLVAEPISFETVPDVERLASLLERGPNISDDVAPVRSAVSRSNVIRAVERSAGGVIVTLSSNFAEVAGSDQVLGLGQIVATLTSVPGIDQVVFRQSGEPLEVPVPNGSIVNRPLTRSDYSSLIVEPSDRS